MKKSSRPDTEGALLSFRGTTDKLFPLILCIGREPNTDKRIINELDSYDFNCHPHCAFWNTSYSVIAQTAGLKIRKLKRACNERMSSPIIYADALPGGLKNSVENKPERRKNIPTAEKKKHVTNVFKFDLINRVEVVLTSGLDGPAFKESKSQRNSLKTHATSRRFNSFISLFSMEQIRRK